MREAAIKVKSRRSRMKTASNSGSLRLGKPGRKIDLSNQVRFFDDRTHPRDPIRG